MIRCVLVPAVFLFSMNEFFYLVVIDVLIVCHLHCSFVSPRKIKERFGVPKSHTMAMRSIEEMWALVDMAPRVFSDRFVKKMKL